MFCFVNKDMKSSKTTTAKAELFISKNRDIYIYIYIYIYIEPFVFQSKSADIQSFSIKVHLFSAFLMTVFTVHFQSYNSLIMTLS